jgi:O-antigen/teichoic acid export membrane protein
MIVVVVSSVSNFAFIWWAAKRYIRIRLYADWPYWKSTLRDTFPIAISIVLNLMYFRADTILLRTLQGAYDVGLYGAAYKVLEILNTFPLMFVGLLLPALGAAFAIHDQETFQRIFRKGFTILLIGVIPLLVFGWILAEPILVLLGGREYAPAAPVLRILFFAVAALFFGSLSGHVITIIHRQRQMVWGYLTVAIIGLGLYLLLIPRWSLYGAAIGTLVTESITAIIGYGMITRTVGFRLRVTGLGRIIGSALALIIVTVVLAPLNRWVAAGAGAIVYAGVLVRTGVLSLDVLRGIVRTPSSSVTTLPE